MSPTSSRRSAGPRDLRCGAGADAARSTWWLHTQIRAQSAKFFCQGGGDRDAARPALFFYFHFDFPRHVDSFDTRDPRTGVHLVNQPIHVAAELSFRQEVAPAALPASREISVTSKSVRRIFDSLVQSFAAIF